MNANVPGIVVGSVARSYDGQTYYRATAKTAEGLISFKMQERPASGANVLLDIYKAGEKPEFMDEQLKRDLAVCKLEDFDIEVLKTADELLNEIKDIVLG
mgnify:FL=1